MSGEASRDFEIFPFEIPVAAALVGLSCTLAFFQIYQHVTHYKVGVLQRPIIRILLMVPVYGITSILSLSFKTYSIYIDLARDTYEAFILYQFMVLLVEYCGGERELVRVLNCKNGRAKHLFPCCCLEFRVDKDFLMLCKRGTLQYCFVKPLTALLAVICSLFGVYHEELDFFAADAYPTLFIVNNVCVGVSMYYLVLFGTALEEELRNHKPMMKFMCIKCIIFFSFWQSAALTVLVHFGWLIKDRYPTDVENLSPSPQPIVTAKDIQAALQDFMVCCEMVGIAVMHHWAFTYSVLVSEATRSRFAYLFSEDVIANKGKGKAAHQQLKVVTNVGDAVNITDCVQDAVHTFGKGKAELLLEDDVDYERAFGQSDRKMDPRTRLPFVDLDPARVAHFPYFFRNDRTMFYFFGPVKRMTSKGKWIPCILAISDTALYLLTPHGEPKRSVALENIVEVMAANGTISFRIPTEYDMQLKPDAEATVNEITHILTQWFRVFGEGRELKTEFFEATDLNLETPRDFEVKVLEPPRPVDVRTGLKHAVVPQHLRHLFVSLSAEGSVLYFFAHVLRIKPHLQATRYLAITDTTVAIYKPEGDMRRCIACGDIEELCLDYLTCQIAFIVPTEYDLLVQVGEVDQLNEITTILQAWYKYFSTRTLRVASVSKADQRKLVLRDPEFVKNQAPWHMGHRKGKDKRAKYGPKFGVSLDDFAVSHAPGGDFKWSRDVERAAAGNGTLTVVINGAGHTTPGPEGGAGERDDRNLRSPELDDSSDDESTVQAAPAVVLGLSALSSDPSLRSPVSQPASAFTSPAPAHSPSASRRPPAPSSLLVPIPPLKLPAAPEGHRRGPTPATAPQPKAEPAAAHEPVSGTADPEVPPPVTAATADPPPPAVDPPEDAGPEAKAGVETEAKASAEAATVVPKEAEQPTAQEPPPDPQVLYVDDPVQALTPPPPPATELPPDPEP
jgi:hypothetical protein